MPNKIKVCIVDDSPEARESIAGYIARAPDFECVGAFETGEEALKMIPSMQPDVVLMDIDLPGMSGIQCAKLKDSMPQLQALMLTVYETSERIFEALSAGACGYLLKSTQPEQLLDAVMDVKWRLPDVEPHRPQSGSSLSSHIAEAAFDRTTVTARAAGFESAGRGISLQANRLATGFEHRHD